MKCWQKQASSKNKSSSLGPFFKAYQRGKITGSSHPLGLSQQLTPTPLAVGSTALTYKCGPRARVRKAWCGYLIRETSELMTSSLAWRLFSALAVRHWLWGLTCRKLISTERNTVATCVLWLWKCACNKCIREVWEKLGEPEFGVVRQIREDYLMGTMIIICNRPCMACPAGSESFCNLSRAWKLTVKAHTLCKGSESRLRVGWVVYS